MALLEIGMLGMLFFVLCSNVLNYVSIATTQWLEDEGAISLWGSCGFPSNVDSSDKQNAYRPKCFKDIPPNLIATGTALNCFSLLLLIMALLSLVNAKFRKRVSLNLVMMGQLATLLSLLFNSTGWSLIFNPQFQNTFRVLSNNGNPKLITPGFRFGWSFWLMTGSFAASVLGSISGSFLLGSMYTMNKFNASDIRKSYQTVLPKYMRSDPILTMFNHKNSAHTDEMRF